MGPVVVDIETVGRFDCLSSSVQEYLIERELKRLESNGENGDAQANVIESLPQSCRWYDCSYWTLADQ